MDKNGDKGMEFLEHHCYTNFCFYFASIGTLIGKKANSGYRSDFPEWGRYHRSGSSMALRCVEAASYGGGL